jgi:uncharacterized integral membrane protein
MPLQKDLWLKDKNTNRPYRSSMALAPVWVRSKLVLGLLLVVLLVLFLVQNGQAIHVDFMWWETDMSQALVVFMALLFGAVLGVALTRWLRGPSSHRRGGL